MTSGVVVLYVLGLALPIYGLVRAYRSATSSYRTAVTARAEVKAVNDQENAARDKLMNAGATTDEHLALSDRYAKMRVAAGGRNVTLGEDFLDKVTVSPEPFAIAVRENRWNFLWVGAGALCATVASIWSLFLE